jgi:hypothetical protein
VRRVPWVRVFVSLVVGVVVTVGVAWGVGFANGRLITPRYDGNYIVLDSTELFAAPGATSDITHVEPILPTLLVNTLFYGSIVFGLSLVPGVVRRWHRRRRGRCVACGYELAGVEVCPECGLRGHVRER